MRGFTLIETLLYIALLSFLLTAGVLTSYRIATNSDKIQANTATHDEGNFVLRKIDWALSDLKSIDTPGSNVSQSLTITRSDNTQINIRRDLTNGCSPITPPCIEMRVGTLNAYVPLTTSNVSVTALQFGYISGIPAGVEASTTINGIVFTTRRYLPN